MASGWTLLVWLECIGVVSGCCCKEVYRYPHNNTYPFSTCISSFFAAAFLLLCLFFNVFSFFYNCTYIGFLYLLEPLLNEIAKLLYILTFLKNI